MTSPRNLKRHWITRWLIAAPEIFLTLFAWLLVLAFAWMRYPIVGNPYELNTVWYIATCILASLFPIVIVTRWRHSSDNPSMVITPSPALKLFWIVCMISLGLSAVVVVYTMQAVLGADLNLEDYRALKGQMTGSSGRLAQLNYLFMGLGLIGCYLTNRLTVSNTVRLCFAAYLLGLFAIVYLMIGIRTHFLAPVVVFSISYLLFQANHINARRLRIGALSVGGILSLILINAALSAIGASGGFFGTASQSMGDRGAVMLQGLGVNNPGVEASVVFAFLDEYLVSPVYYLDYYINNVNHDPAYGALQFDFLARRFGFDDRYVIKLEVDAAYGALNLNWNVWATGIREIAIDFGKGIGAVLAFATIGLLAAMAKLNAHRSLAAGLIFSMLASFLVISPATSLFRSSFFQYGFYFALIGWVFETLSRRRPFTRQPATSLPGQTSSADTLLAKHS